MEASHFSDAIVPLYGIRGR